MKRLLFKSVVNEIVCCFLDVLDKMNVPEAGKKFDEYIIDDEDVDRFLSRLNPFFLF